MWELLRDIREGSVDARVHAEDAMEHLLSVRKIALLVRMELGSSQQQSTEL